LKNFRDAIRQKDFVVTAVLPLRSSSTLSEIEVSAEVLSPVVDALQIGDDPFVVGHMSTLAAASILLRKGIDAVVHISCRDRNRIALQADIRGAAVLGVTTLVLTRGEKLIDIPMRHAKGVFHIGETQLIKTAGQIGADVSLVSDPGFHIGSLVTVFKPAEDWEAGRIQEKVDVGVKFLQTQPCLNSKLLRIYMQKLVDRKITHRASVMVEIPLLTSAKDAKAIKTIYRGATIPDAMVKRIVQAPDPVAEGVSVCAEMIADLRTIPGVSGVNLRHGKDPHTIVAAVRQAGLTS